MSKKRDSSDAQTGANAARPKKRNSESHGKPGHWRTYGGGVKKVHHYPKRR